MSKSSNWSSVSAPCRLEWRASRWLAAMLLCIGLLSAFSALASELPGPVSMPMAMMAVCHGAWLARRELRRPLRCLLIPMNDATPTLDGAPMSELQLQWRGPLAFLRWRNAEGRRMRGQVWPDSLAAGTRRELRLAMAARTPARKLRSMAP